MNSKKIINTSLGVVLMLLLSACAKFTGITPKGSNILNRVSDLDLLLNYNFSLNSGVRATDIAFTTTAGEGFNCNDAEVLVNDTYPYVINVATLISSGTKDLNAALTTYNESIDRKNLALADAKYEKMYFIINNICNVVLKNADGASGDPLKARQLKAESYILRAYMHYLLVNLYAKAYNPATAGTDGGIPYVKEDNLVSEPNKKSTVAEVYNNMMADVDAAFALNSLPNTPANNMRVGLGFAYAVRAQILLSMRNYAGARVAADASLAINSNLIDDRLFAPVGTLAYAKPPVTASDNLFYASNKGPSTLAAPTFETLAAYEPGNIQNEYVKPYFPVAAQGEAITGLKGAKLSYSPGIYALNTAGLTTSDTYLIKAECLARTQNISGAMDIINMIRQRRIHPSVYTPLTASTEAQAIFFLKKTAKFEFLYTFKNFFNIKRWNTEDAYKETISRTINGVTYQLKPESPLWIFPFPQSGTAYNPNLTQNY
jgi:hypothetical protein